VAAPVFRVASGAVPFVAAPVAMLASPPVTDLVLSGLLLTRAGRAGVAGAIVTIGRGINWLVRKTVQFVHNAIDWVGHRIGDAVGVFSQNGRARVYKTVASFSETRELAGGWVRNKLANGYDRVAAAAATPMVGRAVAIMAGAIMAVIGLSMLAPVGFVSAVAASPLSPWLQAQVLALGAGGSFVDVTLLSGTFAAATTVAMVRQAFRRDEAYAEFKAEAAAGAHAAPVYDITDAAEGLVPGQTPITEENRADLLKEAEADFRPGPGKRGKDYPAKGKGGK
jgi:hypothetical protein